MQRGRLCLLAVLFVAAQAAAQQTPAQRVPPPPGEIPHIVAYDKDGLLGDQIHIFGHTAELGKWDNSIASMVMLGGQWDFFDEDHLKGTKIGE